MRDKHKQSYIVTVEMHAEETPASAEVIADAITMYLAPWSNVTARKVNVKESLEITYA